MANLGHDAEQRNLADVGAFAPHIWTRADLGAGVGSAPQVGVIRNKGLFHEGIQHRVAALADVDLCRLLGVQELGAYIPAESESDLRRR